MEGIMTRHLIALILLALASAGNLVASDYSGGSDLIAEVSFEYQMSPGPLDVVYASRAYSVQFYSYGEIHLVDLGGDQEGSSDEWYVDPIEERLVYQLNEDEYDWLMEVVYLLGEAELSYDDFEGSNCRRMEPPLVNSDLYILGYQDDYSLVLSDGGCWREFYVYPFEQGLYQYASSLKEWLLAVGKSLLLNNG